MLKTNRIVISLVLLSTSLICNSRDRFFKKIYLSPTECIGLDSNSFTKVLPEKNLQLKSLNSSGLTFETTYEGLSPAAKTAMEYALSLWSQYFNSPVPIKIYVNAETMEGNALASAMPNGFYYGFEGYDPNILYPLPLAEKIMRRNLNGEESYDIDISVSRDNTIWYYGTDGNTPAGKYDFVSVIMHEMGHGMGFIGSMSVNTSDLGYWGYNFYDKKVPVFDPYIRNGSGQYMLDETLFSNPSSLLKDEYTGDDLYFNSPISLIKSSQSNYPRLYAPSTFQQGSSIYHLNDATYPKGDVNSLMTHSTGTAEAIHVLGPLAAGIFEEIGWSHTYIDHTPMKDIDEINVDIQIGADIISDFPPVSDQNYLFYRTNIDQEFDSLPMNKEEDGLFYATYLTSDSVNLFEYYIKAYDGYGRLYKRPYNGPDSVYMFNIGPDTIDPVLNYVKPISYVIVGTDSVEISVRADDNLGIDSVIAEYGIKNTAIKIKKLLNSDTLDYYTGYISLNDSLIKVGDTITYDIIIVDKSKNHNSAVFHNEIMEFVVEELPPVIDEYWQDFEDYGNDFDGVQKGAPSLTDKQFLVTSPSGFNNKCLHTPNPYESPGVENGSYEYIATLRYRIKLKDNAALRFDEIVLVEPGETGTEFGEQEFWDYVIVEASKDSGNTWKYIQPGYDCRKNSSWVSTYNSSFDNSDNSTAVGTPSLYISHFISFKDNPYFSSGDTVLIRFRLYSDPFANGWGWAIDNLNIQGPNSVKPLPFDNAVISVYPNPVSEKLYLDAKFDKTIDHLNIKLVDIWGRTVKSETLYGIDVFNTTFDMEGLPKGMYILLLDSGNDKRTRKILKR